MTPTPTPEITFGDSPEIPNVEAPNPAAPSNPTPPATNPTPIPLAPAPVQVANPSISPDMAATLSMLSAKAKADYDAALSAVHPDARAVLASPDFRTYANNTIVAPGSQTKILSDINTAITNKNAADTIAILNRYKAHLAANTATAPANAFAPPPVGSPVQAANPITTATPLPGMNPLQHMKYIEDQMRRKSPGFTLAMFNDAAKAYDTWVRSQPMK